MTIRRQFGISLVTAIAGLGLLTQWAGAQNAGPATGPDPREIRVPPIKTSLGTMPGVNELPTIKGMPDVMVMNNGTKVASPAQWKKRREEMKRILEYYAVGLAPPPPGNVKGKQTKSELVQGGKVRYRLIRLTFGPRQSLSLDIGIFLVLTDFVAAL